MKVLMVLWLALGTPGGPVEVEVDAIVCEHAAAALADGAVAAVVRTLDGRDLPVSMIECLPVAAHS